jgi:hypothetical protein
MLIYSASSSRYTPYHHLSQIARWHHCDAPVIAISAARELPAKLSKEKAMIRNIRRAMAAMFGLALTAAVSLQASAQDDVAPVDVMQDETSVAQNYGQGCCDTACCCSGNVYGEFQWVHLDQYATEGAGPASADEEDGYRIVGGYQGCDGLGVRGRYFDFDGIQNNQGLDLEYFDLEVTEAFNLCCLNGVLSAGYRHGEYQEDNNNADFEGDGVTLGIMLQRDLGCHLGLYAWAQHSILYGDDDANNRNDTLLGWTEIQLGAQYNTCVAGYNAFARAGVEAQRIEGMTNDNTQDAGLLGWFLSAGVNF